MIKVRAWNGSEFYIPIIYGSHVYRDGRAFEDCIPTDDPVTQFTGLTDKNGVEIYEMTEINHKYRVVWRNASYVLQNISTGDIIGLLSSYMVKNNEPEVTREYAPMEKD